MFMPHHHPPTPPHPLLKQMALDNASTSVVVFQALQTANHTMKRVTGGLTEEKVEKLMDEMQEIQETQDLGTEALTGGASGIEDDEELLAELDIMSKEMETDQLSSLMKAPATTAPASSAGFGSLPTAPTTRPAGAALAHSSSAEDEERRALESLSAGMFA